ncbi:glycerol dehydrogenase [Chryseobacterium rhizosphaerae]|uniref:glycerol dehydrogenase n=1 Tax=Chryseobacterium rhizosphaerae TaxID=395937 RepID=UPI002359E4C3|nr:glycerol dehydrogenase [Chryseobacterium rhizosphaerae]MDC8099742.1 glycerol dehydrogenase [Chryseobacterium rhizosphaerae]MDR6547331.1 glycerol dehydrogenase [Chryseobacterium rhizosphaerae]
MNKIIFSSPGKYVQGMHIINELGSYLVPMGKMAFLIADDIVWNLVKTKVVKSLDKEQVEYHYESFRGEASINEISRLAKIGKSRNIKVVVGLGGGKTLDVAKAIADELGVSVAIIPTVASTDAPCSGLSVLYTEDGAFDRYRFYKKNPDLVLVDSYICAQAPVRLFASGIADGLATYVEAQAVYRSNSKSMVGGQQTIAGMAISKACEETLLKYGYSAYKAVEVQKVTPAVEAVIEANTLLSGLGFENGGLAAAHAIHNGFTALSGDVHHLTHGEKVAYGTLTHMLLEGRSDEEIIKYIKFYRSINMPTTLEDMHLENVSYEELLSVGEKAGIENDTLHNLNPTLTAEQVANALIGVNVLSKTIF